MSISLPIIFLIILLVFRDLKIALLSLVPNLFPLGVYASGIMYLVGDDLNIGNVIVFAVCLGIAVDDTIHFISNYKLKELQGLSPADAMKQTMEQTGKALTLTTILLVVAFGLFTSETSYLTKNSVLTVQLFFLSLFADLIILPAAIVKKPKVL